MKDSMVTIEKVAFPTAMLVDGLGQIRDTEWPHTNPI